MINYERITDSVKEICLETGDFIKKELNKLSDDEIENKGRKNNLVTYVDKSAEEKLVAFLHQLLPQAGFIAEEGSGGKPVDGYNWIIDPLDGTTNFVHKMAPFAISIALSYHNEIVSGVVYEINLDECFYAWKNSNAFMNSKEIKVSTAKTIDESLIATGFPYSDYDKMKGILKSLEYFIQHSHGIRRLGSAATDLAYVACGRLDAFYEYALNAWDVAAGALIVQQAGGRVSDFSGSDNYIFGKEIVATNGFVFNEFLGIMKKFLG